MYTVWRPILLVLTSLQLSMANGDEKCEDGHGLYKRDLRCPDPDDECTTIKISYSGNDDDLDDNAKLFLGEYHYFGKITHNNASIYYHSYEQELANGVTDPEKSYLVKDWGTDEYWKVVESFPVTKTNTVLESGKCEKESVLDCNEEWSIRTKNHNNKNNNLQSNWVGKDVNVGCGASLGMASIIGIVAGVIVLIAIIAIVAVLVMKKKRKDGKSPNHTLSHGQHL